MILIPELDFFKNQILKKVSSIILNSPFSAAYSCRVESPIE